MPAGGRGPPPKDCPICRERVWSREDTTSVLEAWERYSVHVHMNHPEYEGWNRRWSRNYMLALPPFVALSVAATQVASADLAKSLIILSVVLAFAVLAQVFVTKRIGTRRFRESWIEEHGGASNPR